MKVFLLSGVLFGCFAMAVSGQTTPLDKPLAEETEVTISCELTEAPRHRDIVVFENAKDAEAARGVYQYKLWIPKGYLADPQKRWPCLFIMSPGGNASMETMADYLKSNGYVVVMLVEAKNGPWGPIVGNFLAAHDDVIKRVRLQEEQKFATGFSGGARGSSVFVQARPGFKGLILQGAGAAAGDDGHYLVTGLKRNSKLHVAMIMGKEDSNHVEAERIDGLLPSSRYRVFEFAGGHQWAPAEVFAEAMTWIREKSEVKSGLPRR